MDSSRDPVSGLSVLRRIDARTVYRLADYPSTAHSIASGEAFVAAVDLDTSDPAEVRLLEELEYRAVLVVGVSSAACSYVLEIFSRTGHQELTAIAPCVRVLAQYCITKCDGHLQHEVVVDRQAAEGERVVPRASHDRCCADTGVANSRVAKLTICSSRSESGAIQGSLGPMDRALCGL